MEKNKEFVFVETYIDDGYSGLRYYNRPGFQKMLSDIEEKRINTIITKDMSRFGRESIETSTYLEKIFPEMGVRYISILDYYDSLTGQNTDIAPFKILFNDMYSKDISRKVRGSFDVKRRNGQFIGSSPPYGYLKDKQNHNKLIIDEYAQTIVRRIFALYIEGNGKGAIAGMLERDGILTPSVYKKEVLKENYYNPNIKYTKTSWSFQTIHQILTNEVYIGNMVQKRHETISYKVRKKRPVPKEDQIIVEGTHEAIIDKETFDTVQKLIKNRIRSTTNNHVENNLFAGKLICADCGHTFTKTYNSRKKEFRGYVCSQYKRHGNLYCTSHMINKEEIESLVLDLIKKEVKCILKEEDKRELLDSLKVTENEEFKSIKIQINALQDKTKELSQYKQKTFESYIDGTVSKEDYREFTKRYEEQINNYNEKIQDLQNKIVKKKEVQIEYNDWVSGFINNGKIDKLTREMVVELIEKVVIDDKKNIDIYFNFKAKK